MKSAEPEAVKAADQAKFHHLVASEKGRKELVREDRLPAFAKLVKYRREEISIKF